MEIRDYRAADARAIAELFHGAVHAIPERDYTRAQRQAWAPTPPDYPFWVQRLATTRPYVAQENDRVVGFIELEGNGHIDCLYVHKEHQRRGIATALLDHARAVAIARGIPTLTVEASSVAKAFFLNAGFRVIADNRVTRGGQTLVNYRMQGRP